MQQQIAAREARDATVEPAERNPDLSRAIRPRRRTLIAFQARINELTSTISRVRRPTRGQHTAARPSSTTVNFVYENPFVVRRGLERSRQNRRVGGQFALRRYINARIDICFAVKKTATIGADGEDPPNCGRVFASSWSGY